MIPVILNMSWRKDDEDDEAEAEEDEEGEVKAGEDRIVFLVDARFVELLFPVKVM